MLPLDLALKSVFVISGLPLKFIPNTVTLWGLLKRCSWLIRWSGNRLYDKGTVLFLVGFNQTQVENLWFQMVQVIKLGTLHWPLSWFDLSHFDHGMIFDHFYGFCWCYISIYSLTVRNRFLFFAVINVTRMTVGLSRFQTFY